jgi:glyoxylase I family protein
MTEPAAWSGVHHLTLNVQDVAASERWYREVLGFDRLTEYETEDFRRVLLRHAASGMVLGLNRHTSPEAAEPFSERRAGLDHLALRVADRAALEAWAARFDALGVEHSPIQPAVTPGSALVVFRDPDGIQLEIFAPPPA